MIHQPFELKYWFIQVFSGGMELFMLLSILIIAFMCAKFKMGASSFLVMLLMFAGILMTNGMKILMIAIILIVGGIGFWITRRVTE